MRVWGGIRRANALGGSFIIIIIMGFFNNHLWLEYYITVVNQ
jgi:hypothetical protein